ncbi:MAG: GLPGLI family protein [Duncaniella sp.]|nr:GLPGLI family protein [Duncaniella sp.]
MKKIILSSLILAFASVLPASAQSHRGGERNNAPNDERAAKLREEANAYYANADTADYGVRYKFSYLFNKEHNLRFEEDRVLLITPRVTLDMSYQGIGEDRWHLTNPGARGGDTTLSYRLTPDYYFYYPESGRAVRTYRIISEEFKLEDGKSANAWKLSDEQRMIGDYNCRRADLDKGGRHWTAWYTNDLPAAGAPRDFHGLPGVVIELSDADGEVQWRFNSIVNHIEGDTLFIKYPDTFTELPVEKFPKILKLFAAIGDNNYLKGSGVMEKRQGNFPKKYRPSTGVDACLIDNPIEK